MSQLEAKHSLVEVLQALLVASPNGVSIAKLVEVLAEDGITATMIKKAFKQLNAAANGLFAVVETAGEYQLALKQSFAPYLQKLKGEGPQKLRRAMLEVLSIIMHYQPISRGEIEEKRGVAANVGVYEELVDRGWITVVGYGQELGKPQLYGTTKALLEYFGMGSLREFKEQVFTKEIFNEI